MAFECTCFRLFAFPFKSNHLWQVSRSTVLYKVHLSKKLTSQIREISPTLQFCWPLKINSLLKSHSYVTKPLLSTYHPQFLMGKMGLKYQSNHNRNFVKEVKRQDVFRTVRGQDMIRGVGRAFQDRRNNFRQTRERWKKSSRRILADIKETKTKMREKMEEVIERENVYTVPNLLCVSRIVLSPYLGSLILQQDFHWALGILAVAGVTDLLDGWIARTFKNQSSKLGSFLDPMADKILIATMFLTLTYVDIIPVALTGLIITRDVGLVAAGFVIRYKSLPPPRTLSRYFDVTHATAQLAPTFISKVNTMVQLVMVASTLAAPVFGYLEHPALHALWYVTAGTTIASAGSYLLSKNTFKFLKKSSNR